MSIQPAGGGQSSFEVRGVLEDLLERDLLGPWDGPEEELPVGTIPAERYLLGRLVPHSPDRGQPEPATHEDDDFTEPELVDRDVSVDADDTDDRQSEGATRSGSMASSALGLSFVVPDDVTSVRVEATWGRYERGPSLTQVTEQGRPRVVWHRRPAGGAVEVPVHAEGDGSDVPDAEQEGVVIRHRAAHPRVVGRSLGLPSGSTPTTGHQTAAAKHLAATSLTPQAARSFRSATRMAARDDDETAGVVQGPGVAAALRPPRSGVSGVAATLRPPRLGSSGVAADLRPPVWEAGGEVRTW